MNLVLPASSSAPQHYIYLNLYLHNGIPYSLLYAFKFFFFHIFH